MLFQIIIVTSPLGSSSQRIFLD